MEDDDLLLFYFSYIVSLLRSNCRVLPVNASLYIKRSDQSNQRPNKAALGIPSSLLIFPRTFSLRTPFKSHYTYYPKIPRTETTVTQSKSLRAFSHPSCLQEPVSRQIPRRTRHSTSTSTTNTHQLIKNPENAQPTVAIFKSQSSILHQARRIPPTRLGMRSTISHPTKS